MRKILSDFSSVLSGRSRFRDLSCARETAQDRKKVLRKCIARVPTECGYTRSCYVDTRRARLRERINGLKSFVRGEKRLSRQRESCDNSALDRETASRFFHRITESCSSRCRPPTLFFSFQLFSIFRCFYSAVLRIIGLENLVRIRVKFIIPASRRRRNF